MAYRTVSSITRVTGTFAGDLAEAVARRVTSAVWLMAMIGERSTLTTETETWQPLIAVFCHGLSKPPMPWIVR